MAYFHKSKPFIYGIVEMARVFNKRKVLPISERSGFFIPKSQGLMRPVVHFRYHERALELKGSI